MELQPISDFSQRSWGFHTVRGGDDPRELGFIPRFVKRLDIYSDLWTGDGSLLSPVGACSILYDPQPLTDRPVGGVVYVWMGSDSGVGRCRLQMTDTSCTIPGQ